MALEKREAAIEAILFTMGDAVEAEKIAAAIELDTPSTEKLLHEMMERYREEDRGIQMIELDHSYQLCTKKEYYETLIKIARQPQKIVLTDVLMETLSIIAYKQPVTRIEIEKIRGVKSDHAVNKLVEFGLVKELQCLVNIAINPLSFPSCPILVGLTPVPIRTILPLGIERRPSV